MSRNELPNQEVLISILKTMLKIRQFEEALYHAFMTEKMPGTMHQAIGMEAVSSGVCHAINTNDVITSTHRGHGHAIAKGIPLESLMAELYARKTGTSKGLGGSLHIFGFDQGFLGTTGIVGAGVPIAVGAGLAAQLEGEGRVAIAFFGDGAANQGVVHEALNLAAIWQLPVIFICENNRYAVSMPIEKAAVSEHIADRAAAYGMPGSTFDGNDVLSVYNATREAVSIARTGGGPTLIEFLTYRYKGHSRFEPARYRPEGELEAWMAKDPIPRYQKWLLNECVLNEKELELLTSEVAASIEEAILFAKNSPETTVDDVDDRIFANLIEGD
jgi:TPP-dependent pyruvate/acetoin dehydrogenase alpha subunit